MSLDYGFVEEQSERTHRDANFDYRSCGVLVPVELENVFECRVACAAKPGEEVPGTYADFHTIS